MKTPCITSGCPYGVAPKSKSGLCEKCAKLKRKRELRAKNKLLSIQPVEKIPYADILFRMEYAEEELECLDMYFKDLGIPDNLGLSRIGKLKFTGFIDSSGKPVCIGDTVILEGMRSDGKEYLTRVFEVIRENGKILQDFTKYPSHDLMASGKKNFDKIPEGWKLTIKNYAK